MTTQNFSRKLDTLPATLDLFHDFDASGLATALEKGVHRHALSIGSGGSAIAAEYLARCRDTLGLGPTSVQTPMQAVLEFRELCGSDVWLFSAGGDNPDVTAAVHAVLDRRCADLHLVTRNPDGAAAQLVRQERGTVHVLPVADIKDGYLATHSLLSSTVALLLASDLACHEPRGAEPLLEELVARVTTMRDLAVRSAAVDSLASLRSSDTVIVAADPLLRPLAVLLDTSIWEASLCPVQTTDFRNLAHGRHAWLHHRGENTFIFALVGRDSQITWSNIDSILPSSLRRQTFEYGACGRLENVFALVDGLRIIESMGVVIGIDPGKPGVGEFGRQIYDDRSLAELAQDMPAPLRHKRAAIARSDTFDLTSDPLLALGRDRLKVLANAKIGGAVFDYDGTIVTTEGRYNPPEGPVIEELVRLHRAGLKIGIATGRGGSAGEELRKLLPAEVQRSIVIGYYNGGHLRTADVDIDVDRAPADESVADAAKWLHSHPELFFKPNLKVGAAQVTVEMKTLRSPYRFALDLSECEALRQGRVRVVRSGHSYDIVPAASSKLAVVEAIQASLQPDEEILRFGDSGSKSGNDYALLSHPFGISVGDVCGTANGCWSLFGASPVGPSAVLKVLRALTPSQSGDIYLDISLLGLDSL